MAIKFVQLPLEYGSDRFFSIKTTTEKERILDGVQTFKLWLENANLGLNDEEKNDFFSWLVKNGYFSKPASINFHGNTYCGLFEHSAEVANRLADYTERLGLKWQRPESPMIVGYFHDLCKTSDYIFNEQKQVYVHAHNCLLRGHGEKSVMLLATKMRLTEEEMLCIRYHMGAYNSDEWEQFDLAIRRYPNVLYTHTADMYASKVSGL